MPLKTVFAILSAQEGVLNSSSNNSKFKNIDELKARMAAKSGGAGGFGGGVSSGGGFGGGFGSKLPKRQQQQVIIEEIDDAPKQQRLFDYNLNQVDKSLLPPKDRAKPIMVGVVILVSLAFGAFIGSCWQYVFAQRAEVNLRIDVAQKIEPTIKQKVDNFQTFAQLFKQRSESLGAGVLEYNEHFYNDVIKKYNEADYDFVLDVSKLPANVISMASNSAQNPLSDIRGYGAGTSLLAALLQSHIDNTEKDAAEIKQILGTSSATDRNIVYAIKVNATDVLKITEADSDRTLKALQSTEIYQVKSALTDDADAAKAFEAMHASGRLSDDEYKARIYAPAKAKTKAGAEPVVEITTDTTLTLPNRLIYVIADNDGKEQTVFADEIVLLERTKLFSGSANALERYRNRMIQILAIMGEIEKSTDGLASRIHIIASEAKL